MKLRQKGKNICNKIYYNVKSHILYLHNVTRVMKSSTVRLVRYVVNTEENLISKSKQKESPEGPQACMAFKGSEKISTQAGAVSY